MQRSALALTAAAAIAGACGSEGQGHTHAELGDPTGMACPEGGTSLNYAEFGRPFMEAYCISCHSDDVVGANRQGAPSDHNFDTQFECQAFADHLDRMSGSGPEATNTQMPPKEPRPSPQERQMLSEWLACGAP